MIGFRGEVDWELMKELERNQTIPMVFVNVVSLIEFVVFEWCPDVWSSYSSFTVVPIKKDFGGEPNI